MSRQWLREIRDAQSLTQKQTSEMAQISDSYYSLIESGERGVSTTIAKKLAEVLGFEAYGFDWTKFFE